MAKKARELTAVEVARITVPGLHAVGVVPGLYLQVPKSDPANGNNRTARTWVLRMMIGAKRRDMGLGGYPAVTLAQAREKARAKREEVSEGVDPIEARRAARSALLAAQAEAMTFEQCARTYITAKQVEWKNEKHAQQWANSLAQHAYPAIGDLLVRDVGLAQVLKVLEPIWLTTTETASRVRGRIETVLDWATARRYRDGLNPARWKGHLDKMLPKPSKVAKVEHHAALPVADMGDFMAKLRTAEGMGARALEFTVLTAARSGEVRGATWGEVDLDAAVWIIPAERMKAGKEHRVPLSTAALSLLEALPHVAGTDLVFPAPRGGQLSDMTLTAVLRRMGVSAVPHGFRSTFRDWCSERTAYPRDVAEMALAHSIPDKVEAAYRRGDLFEKRTLLMADWATYCAKPQRSGDVIPMTRKPATAT